MIEILRYARFYDTVGTTKRPLPNLHYPNFSKIR
jgi:hypothetical protein